MAQPITITLPDDVMQALDDLSHKEGVSLGEVVRQAVRQHVFLRQFRSLRERMLATAKSQGIVTDQDVFDRVS